MLRPRLDSAPGALRLALVFLGALGLAGCGVKGPLEPPPGAQVTAPAARAAPAVAPTTSHSAVSMPTTADEMANSVTGQPQWKNSSKSDSSAAQMLQGAQAPNQPFILDGLL